MLAAQVCIYSTCSHTSRFSYDLNICLGLPFIINVVNNECHYNIHCLL